MDKIDVTKECLKKFSKVIENGRKKKHMNEIEFDHLEGELQHDFFAKEKGVELLEKKGEVYCYTIEIKPKWGVFELLDNDICDFKDIKRKFCRYCIQQDSKLKKSSVKKKTNYCPMDLFGNNVEKAIKDLLETPQNNLVMFVNAEKIQKWTDVNVNVVRIVKEVLNRTKVLDRIKKMQLINQYDIEIVYKVYQMLEEKNLLEKTKKELFQDVEQWLDQLNLNEMTEKKFTCKKENPVSTDGIVKKCEDDINLAKSVIRNYVISKTSKDCSILFTFYQTDKEREGELKENEGFIKDDEKMYYFNLGVIDLDEKIFDKIPYWYKQDQEICKLFQKKMKTPKKCLIF